MPIRVLQVAALAHFIWTGCCLAASTAYTEDLAEVAASAEPWTNDPHLGSLKRVTRGMYLDTAQIFLGDVLRTTDQWLSRAQPYPNARAYIENAKWLSFAYRVDKEEAMAARAAKCIGEAYRLISEFPELAEGTLPGWQQVSVLFFIDKWLADSDSYTAMHRTRLRDLARIAAPRFPRERVEYGSFNRAFLGAITGEALLLLVPDAPDADHWRRYKEKIWDYWWRVRDTDESAEHYNALWFRYLLQWVEMREYQEEFWRDTGVRALFERYLYQVFPMGTVPHYSDSTGWNVSWGHWIYLFEACARHFNDGRYRWAAHRIYDYSVNRIEDLRSWSYTSTNAAWSLFLAYSVTNDSLEPIPRESATAVLKRHKNVQRDPATRKATRQFFDLLPELAPDKIVFYGDDSRDALSLMIDVAGNAGHSHGQRPAVIALADQQSVLLHALGYMERRTEDHNVPLLADYDGFPYDNTPYYQASTNNAVREAVALDLGEAGYARVRVERYSGYPASLVREIVFVNGSGVVIRDSLTLDTHLQIRWSPVFRTRNVGPDYGKNWLNTYLGPWLTVRGLGRDEVIRTRWRNSPRDLLIYFSSATPGTLEVVDESRRDSTVPLPLRIQYTLREDARPESPQSVTTLLLPHRSGPARALVDQIRVLDNTQDMLLLEFANEAGRRNLVAMNPLKKRIVTQHLVTDAAVAVIQHDGHNVHAVGLHDARTASWDGRNISRDAPPAVMNVIPRP